ncbi:hypothetical protein [Paenibacillus baekrokdamisoli]|nr:hypothetical protein [Paenibacillus baekrokdamisoli]
MGQTMKASNNMLSESVPRQAHPINTPACPNCEIGRIPIVIAVLDG